LELESYVDTLLRKGIVPGISLLSARGDTVRFKSHYGFKSKLPRKELLHEDTLYDVASLTKPLITALLTLWLVDKKVLAPDTLVREVFPHLHGFGDMNLLHLLTHTSGLPAWYPLYLFGRDYLEQFPAIPLKCKPGKQVVYSCPGYILLYYIIQKAAGTSFKNLAREIIFEPLALKNTFLQVPERLKQNAAPTERGNAYERKIAGQWAASCEGGKFLQMYRSFPWREEIIQGETHDLYSFHLGESAGNTGLFSTTGDLFRLSLEFYPATATL
jgi:CubicO group peptidase (beta-lactamase class C family)